MPASLNARGIDLYRAPQARRYALCALHKRQLLISCAPRMAAKIVGAVAKAAATPRATSIACPTARACVAVSVISDERTAFKNRALHRLPTCFTPPIPRPRYCRHLPASSTSVSPSPYNASPRTPSRLPLRASITSISSPLYLRAARAARKYDNGSWKASSSATRRARAKNHHGTRRA